MERTLSPRGRIIIALNCADPKVVQESRDAAHLLKKYVGGFLVHGTVRNEANLAKMKDSLSKLEVPIFLDTTRSASDLNDALKQAANVVKGGAATKFAFPLWYGEASIKTALALSDSCEMIGIPLPKDCHNHTACLKRFGDGYSTTLCDHVRLFARLGGKALFCTVQDITLLKRDLELQDIEQRRGFALRYLARGATGLFPQNLEGEPKARITPSMALRYGAELLVYSIEDLDHPRHDPVSLVDRVESDIQAFIHQLAASAN